MTKPKRQENFGCSDEAVALILEMGPMRRSWPCLVVLCATARTQPGAVGVDVEPITACLFQRLPASLFKNSTNGTSRTAKYGTGRVAWHALHGKPIYEEMPFRTTAGVPCQALLWQDDEWSQPHYHEYKQWIHESQRSRIVGAWTSESCERNASIVESFDFVFYAAPEDAGTHLVEIPLGPSVAFPMLEAPNLDRFDYLFNLVASLSTSTIHKAWSADAQHMHSRLLAETGWCAFIRVHRDWRMPTDYEDKDPRAFDNCTCANILECAHPESAGSVQPAQWHSVLRRSAFTLSPPGQNYECYRHWEAAEVGSIPVVIKARGIHGEYANTTSTTQSCFESSSAQFADAPFVFVDEAADAFDAMIALARDPAALSERRRAVQRWYQDRMRRSVQRVEAALTAAAAKADADYGPAGDGGRGPAASLGYASRGDTRRKRVGLVLAPDGRLTSRVASWLRWHDVKTATANGFDTDDADGRADVLASWTLAAVADSSRFSQRLLTSSASLGERHSNATLAPILHLATEPLAHIEALARYLERGGNGAGTSPPFATPEEHEHFVAIVRRTSLPPEESVAPFAEWSTPAVHHAYRRNLFMAAMYWFEWHARARALSTFSLQAENADGVTVMAALGVRNNVGASNVRLETFKPSLTWTQIEGVVGTSQARDIRDLAESLGYEYDT